MEVHMGDVLKTITEGSNSVEAPPEKTPKKTPRNKIPALESEPPKRGGRGVKKSADAIVVREPFRIAKGIVLTGACAALTYFAVTLSISVSREDGLSTSDTASILLVFCSIPVLMTLLSFMSLRSQSKGTVIDFENDLISFPALLYFRRSVKLSEITGISYTERMFKKSFNQTGWIEDLLFIRNPRVIKLVGPKFGSRKLTYGSESKADQVHSTLTA
jgi:hypothetical protein